MLLQGGITMRKTLSKPLTLITILGILLHMSMVTVCAQTFEVDAAAAILIDASTGTVLYEKNIHEPLPPASVTKIMTMLLTMEAIDSNLITLEDQVTISERASSMGGTQIYVEPGETKSVEDLIKAIAIRSANDATVAIAEHISGTEELFIRQMNDRAQELGMKNTCFINTNGLPADGHNSSAYDIALMSMELLKHDGIHKWMTTWMDTIEVGKKTKSIQSLVNTNKLIQTYKGITGIKTGSTSEAKYCLSASATRDNNTFIAVILAAPTSPIRFNEATKLLDYGFANFNTVKIMKSNEDMGFVSVNKGNRTEIKVVSVDKLDVLVKKGDESKIEKEIILPQSVKAPIKKGEKIGEIVVTLDGKKIENKDIIAAENIEKASVLDILTRMFVKMMGY